MNNKVSLKHISKQILELLNETKKLSVKEVYLHFFPTSAMNMPMFYNTFILPLVINNDIKLSNYNENDIFNYGSDRILGNIDLMRI